jgi:hypothetical protein
MSAASTEIPGRTGSKELLDPGIHAAYIFDSQSDKQLKLFSLCREAVDVKNASLIYIAGKQGVKGIRLSLKDTGFDVSAYEKKGQMKILDSEEFFLSTGRQPNLRPNEQIEENIMDYEKEALRLGFSELVIICETDMLVRKGFLNGYKDFDASMTKFLLVSHSILVCAFDRREMTAKGVANPESEVGPAHTVIV